MKKSKILLGIMGVISIIPFILGGFCSILYQGFIDGVQHETKWRLNLVNKVQKEMSDDKD